MAPLPSETISQYGQKLAKITAFFRFFHFFLLFSFIFSNFAPENLKTIIFMKKILLLLVSFISLGVAAAEVVSIKEAFPIYSGYITYPGTAQSIFSELVSDLDDDDPSITYSVDRENKSVTMTVREVEEGILTIIKMKFTAATNRINYSIKVKLMMDGEDITSLLVGKDESYFIDGYVSALLEALADEL